MRFPAKASLQAAAGPLAEVNLSSSLDRLYAIGQVHSDVESLKTLDLRIARDAAGCSNMTTAIVQAGGLLDKGTTLPALLAYVRSRNCVGNVPVTYLKGAHEVLMGRALLGDRQAAIAWLLSGAEGSLNAWGIPTSNWVALLPQTVPRSDREFLSSLAGVACVGSMRLVCSTFTENSARPFGLIDTPMDLEALFGPEPVTPIGRFSALTSGAAPEGWRIADFWSVERVNCVVLQRSLT